MNKKISAAIASAALVLGAQSANAGIIIPAGEWTLDINGNVNMFAIMSDADQATTGANGNGSVAGGIAAAQDASGEDKGFGMGTGLLPAWLGFTATTRQNDLDVSWTISFQPNTADNAATGDILAPLNRQAFITFGDKSWGTVKIGKDLGIFAGNAILSDMTLLGVGGATQQGVAGKQTTLGGIGTGYIYPAWKGQIAYTTPNLNGLQATVAITNPEQGLAAAEFAAKQDRYGLEGVVSYSFDMGKVWVSGVSNEITTPAAVGNDRDVTMVDVGVSLNVGNAGFVAYYYNGEGAGPTLNLNDAAGANNGNERDADGGYVQATYVIPTGTKLGVAYGVSKHDLANGETAGATAALDENKRWTVGAYHPLTKHLNLVAEYNNIESKDHQNDEQESDSLSLGAILFF